MKKIISAILIFTMLVSTANAYFVAEVGISDIISYDAKQVNDIVKLNDVTHKIDDLSLVKYEYADEGDFRIKNNTTDLSSNALLQSDEVEQTSVANTTYTNANFTFNDEMFTSFNTVSGPITDNGANEPKYSYNRFLDEKVSDYSGELTLNFEDLILDGKNGLDLRIGRTYQTVASGIGEKSLMVLPNDNGFLGNYLIDSYSTYLIDRYNLGMGWGFSFPSVQIATEYIPEEIGNTYYYQEETQLYYHFGNGDVFKVQFTSDTTDSNLEGYYNKDIQFNKNDIAYSNGQTTSYYSMTLSDKTKQYFANDGRLIGIVDRFGNNIKFEYEFSSIVNIVPEGNFRYNSGMWISSCSNTNSVDAYPATNQNIGSTDGYAMYFRRDNEGDETYIVSRPIQIKPNTNYEFGMRFKSPNGDNIEVEITGFDTAYRIMETDTFIIDDYDDQNWVDFTQSFAMSTAVRYVQIKIIPRTASRTYIDNVRLDEPKPLLKRITDTVGRTVDFEYQGNIASGSTSGAVVLTVSSPDGANTKTLTYNKQSMEFATKYMGRTEQRLFWCLSSSLTEGEDGAMVRYTYEGGATIHEDNTITFTPLYMNYNSKTQSISDNYSHKAVLNTLRYKDRMKVYEYETVRKHLGDDGYYDTLRIKKKYDMYSYVPEGSTKSYYKGELGTVNYSYSGLYNGSSFNNETGYPSYTFDNETTLNEQWTVTKTGKTTDTITFSNCAIVQQTSSSNGTTVKSDYTNHSVFKNSPKGN